MGTLSEDQCSQIYETFATLTQRDPATAAGLIRSLISDGHAASLLATNKKGANSCRSALPTASISTISDRCTNRLLYHLSADTPLAPLPTLVHLPGSIATALLHRFGGRERSAVLCAPLTHHPDMVVLRLSLLVVPAER